jgi:hypothetical protein
MNDNRGNEKQGEIMDLFVQAISTEPYTETIKCLRK